MNVERTIQRIKALGITADLKVPRKLTIEEWNLMHPEVQAYHMEANGASVAAMDDLEVKKAADASKNANKVAERYFTEERPQEETNQLLESMVRWTKRFPQFRHVPENARAMGEWLRANRRAKPSPADFDEGFAELCRTGSITIDLAAIGEGDRIISGYELKTSPIMYKILESATLTAAQKEKKTIEAMSADAYLKATPELHDTRISPIFKAQMDKAIATLMNFHPEYDRTEENNAILLKHVREHQAGLPFDSTQLLAAFDATKHLLHLKSNVSEHGATRVVDYTPRQSTSELLNNMKLNKKVSSMSASEYAAWLRENPSGRAALDARA